ncbi:unnamed protein product, partial [Ixodes hexagonus]
IICDAPAKAFILYIRGHTGYHSCTKCTVKGVYWKCRVCFPDMTKELRTNQSFRCKTQKQHHTGQSIPKVLPIDLVKDVPLDYMHLVCLGVTRKLLLLWTRGPKEVRLGNKVCNEMSERNRKLAQFVPCDFNRKPRSLSELER